MNRNSVSFFIPAYNCASTIKESLESIINGNLQDGDEIVICNDCSTDNTSIILQQFKEKYPFIKIVNHFRNKGGAAARNTAIENSNNDILFCLDSDNILVAGSVQRLKSFLLKSGADVAAFKELRYFKNKKENVTHKWVFKEGVTTLADCLSGPVVPGASGNYMFTKESWGRAGGYPEFAGALDAWGFGFRQLASGSKMLVMSDSYYYHRYGHESYWVRASRKGKTSLIAIQILIPFLDLIDEKDVDYIMGHNGRYDWFEHLDKRPIRVKSHPVGNAGSVIYLSDKAVLPLKNKLGKILNALLRNKG